MISGRLLRSESSELLRCHLMILQILRRIMNQILTPNEVIFSSFEFFSISVTQIYVLYLSQHLSYSHRNNVPEMASCSCCRYPSLSALHSSAINEISFSLPFSTAINLAINQLASANKKYAWPPS